MVLGRVAQTRTPNVSLKGLLKAGFREARRQLPMLPDDFVRASGFADMCPREEVLRAVHSIETGRGADADGMLTFAHGSGLHWALQNKVLPQIDVLRGQWHCDWCGKFYGGSAPPETMLFTFDQAAQIPRPTSCECNEKATFTYVEQWYGDEELKIAGHPDGFLEIPGMDGMGLLEAKSISSRGAYDVKHTPNITHVMQSQVYMWLTGLNWTKVLYWEKGAFGLGCLVEHLVERDDETIEGIKNEIRKLRAGLRGDGPVPSRICAEADCPRAKNCSVVRQCFSTPDHVDASTAAE